MKKTYTTLEVSEQTGATLRQLQWWDTQNWVVPERGVRRQRLYSASQIGQIRRLMEIRRDYRMRFASIPKHGRVRIITQPTEINGVLVIPRAKATRQKR